MYSTSKGNGILCYEDVSESEGYSATSS